MRLPNRFSLLVLSLALFIQSAPAKPQEPDRKVTKATFKVLYSQGGKAVVQPVLPVQLRIVRLTGDPAKPIPAEFMTCDVLRREVAAEDGKKQVYTLTVLKDGGEEYGIQGILFAKE